MPVKGVYQTVSVHRTHRDSRIITDVNFYLCQAISACTCIVSLLASACTCIVSLLASACTRTLAVQNKRGFRFLHVLRLNIRHEDRQICLLTIRHIALVIQQLPGIPRKGKHVRPKHQCGLLWAQTWQNFES